MRIARAWLSLCAVLLIPSAAWSDYLLQPGDTLSLSVAGLPELSQKSTINLDGQASFPFVSYVAVKGLTEIEAQDLIREKFQSQVLQRRTPDGRDVATTIAPNAVTVTVSEYRPIYVNGDVSKPGEQVYRPGLTVRQAIAMAGGLDLVRIRMDNPFLQAAEYAGEYQTLWTDYARLSSSKWRYEAEISGDRDPSKDPDMSAAVPMEFSQSVVKRAREELQAGFASSDAQKAHLKDIVVKSDAQLELLLSRRDADEEGAKADAVDYKRLQDLASRGNILQNRLSESRRLLLLSTTQSLQTRVQIAQVERERAKASRDIERLDEDRRIAALRELSKVSADLARVKARIAAVSEKLTYTGLIRSQLTNDSTRRPRVRIIKTDGQGDVTADEEVVLTPGDTVEVALQVSQEMGVAPDRKASQ